MLPSINTPDRQAQAFPVLTAAQIDRIRPYGTARKVRAGEILFEPGELGMPCFVVLSGKLEILMTRLSGEHVFVTYGSGGFSGEMVLISGARSLSRGRVAGPGEFLELTADALHSLIAKDAELSDIFMRAFIQRRLALITEGLGNVIIMGSRHSANTLRLREFLTRNGHPHTYIDLDSDTDAQELLDRFNLTIDEIPVVICSAKAVLRNPTTQRLAECLGFAGTVDESRIRDVAIVGAGPAGLAAAVYAASEGLDAVVIEANFPGGQAGASSKIENYIGFPTGISGLELTGRAVVQAEKFGAQMLVGQRVVQIHCDQRPYQLTLENGSIVQARSSIIAAGAQYNTPNIANLKQFEGNGIYYAATFMESQLCGDDEVIVIGGGNSAGQAAVFLAETAHKVYMLVRGKTLSETMSRYLVQRISVFDGPAPGIQVLPTVEAEIKTVGRWIAGLTKTGIPPHEIAIFVRSEAELDRAKAAANAAAFSFDVLDQNVTTPIGKLSISTMHLAKGLEFRAVAVMACDDEVIPLQERIETVTDEADLEDVYNTERHLLYVACTRARDHLLVTSTAPASEFLDDLGL
jgi:thioredoxin reductase (NADPH)